MKKNKNQIIDIIFMLFLSFAYVIPLFMSMGIYHSVNQDTYFHLSRIIGLDNVWSSPVNFNNFDHHGTMMNIFYPWLTLYPAFLFYKMMGNLVLSYNIYYFFITFLTMVVSYFSMKQIKNNRYISLLFSIIYTFSAYRAIDIFHRASLGEAVALTFLPLILMGCYEIYIRDYQKWYWLSIGMTLVVYTHLLSVAMVSVFIGGTLFLSFYFWDQKIARLLSLLKATVLTFFLSAGFLIPFIQQSRAQELKVPLGKELSGMAPSDMLTHILNNNYNNYTIGLFLFLGLIGAFIFIKKLTADDLFIFFLGVFVLFCSTNLFPWQLFNHTPVKSLQFVWRLNGFSSLFIAYTMSIVIYYIFSTKNNSWKIMVFTFLALILHLSGVSNSIHANKDSLTLIAPEDAVAIAENYNHTDYANKESIYHPDMINNDQYLLGNQEINPTTHFMSNKLTIELDNSNNKNTVLTTPIYRYKGQVASINGKLVQTKLSKFGTTELTIPPGINKVVITYQYTKLAIASRYLSIVTLILFLLYRFTFSKQKQPRREVQ
ncbi:TPA: YfhO family protein, partial [Enterococcus faecium]|nr:YfhO family protein [Enterococcus faecium]